ncbi:MAG: universal stress protein [Pseudomonadota bacterium]
MSRRRMRIICATDLLPRSEAALERAALMAEQHEAELTLLHVVEPSASERGLEQALLHAQSSLRCRAQRPSWRTRRLPGTVIRAGNPARIVVSEIAHRPGAELLVLGPHRARPVRDTLEGTIAGRALASRSCVTLIVHSRPEASYRRVLLALDVSPASASAIRGVEQLVLSEQATARVVHVEGRSYTGMLNYAHVSAERVADYERGCRRKTTRGIRDFLQSESADQSRFSVHVEAGQAVRGILDTVVQYGPDLLVMGTRGGGRLHRAILGSVANSVIREVSCDVMVVPEGSCPAIARSAAVVGRTSHDRRSSLAEGRGL